VTSHNDACMLLGQLGMNGVTEKSADKALRGFALNKPSSDGLLLIAEMAQEGYPRAIAYLLAKGADPNRASGRWEKAPALAHAITNNRSSARTKRQMVELLLAADGIDVDAKVTVKPHPRDGKDPFRSGTTLDWALHQAMQELQVGKAYDADSQRHARGQLASYRETLPLLVAAGAIVSPTAKKRLAKLGVDAAKPSPTPKKDWAKKARAMLTKKQLQKRDAVFQICDWLSTPSAVADREWSGIVEAIIDASPTFESVAEKVYGKAVSFEDDEGHLCQGWEQYVLLDLVFELLTKEATLESPAWSKLVERALCTRRKCHASDYTETALEELFAASWVKRHRDSKKLRAIEKKTR
jgi:hypothetical protein